MSDAGMAWLPLVAAALLACAAAPAAMSADRPAVAGDTPQEVLPPVGYGSLKQDEVTMSIRSGALLLKVTPLAEGVIRLLAPDTYTRLHGLAESRRPDAGAASSAPVELFLVSFFSYQPDVSFQPEDVQLLHQGRTLRPLAVLPITSGWGRQLLQQQETQSAIYAFEAPLNYELQITMSYAAQSTDAWRNVIQRLQVERTKVQSRAGAESGSR
ncbi:MAG TPA: hypothetical protein VK939_00255 [Longimicrobiales bacterium]|nr:hypothetical protein [Longimicrobiales bacterium]